MTSGISEATRQAMIEAAARAEYEHDRDELHIHWHAGTWETRDSEARERYLLRAERMLDAALALLPGEADIRADERAKTIEDCVAAITKGTTGSDFGYVGPVVNRIRSVAARSATSGTETTR